MGCTTSTPAESATPAEPKAAGAVARDELQAEQEAASKARRAALADVVTLVSRDKRHFSVPRRGVAMSRKLAALAEQKPKIHADVDGDTLSMAAGYLTRHGLADLSRFREAVYLAKGDQDFCAGLDGAAALKLRQAARALGIGPLAGLAERRLDELGAETVPEAGEAPRVIVLTGGPCGGKTLSLATLRERLEESGFNVLTVPEVPTILIGDCGAAFPGFDEHRRHELLEFEAHLLQLQRRFEDSVLGIARSSGRPSVVLCDRGLLDVSAYLTDEMWQPVLDRAGLTADAIGDRYHAVLHLQTAAIGAEAYYSNSNNAARRETVEEAREMDAAVLRAWQSHPKHHVIPNGPGGWNEKLDSLLRVVLDTLGVEAERAVAEADQEAAALSVGVATSGSSIG